MSENSIDLRNLKIVQDIRDAARKKVDDTPNFYWKAAYSNLCVAADHLSFLIGHNNTEENPPH